MSFFRPTNELRDICAGYMNSAKSQGKVENKVMLALNNKLLLIHVHLLGEIYHCSNSVHHNRASRWEKQCFFRNRREETSQKNGWWLKTLSRRCCTAEVLQRICSTVLAEVKGHWLHEWNRYLHIQLFVKIYVKKKPHIQYQLNVWNN